MDLLPDASARFERRRGELLKVAARLARVRGGGDADTWCTAVESHIIRDTTRAAAWLAAGAGWDPLGDALVDVSGVTAEEAQTYFYHGASDTPPVLVLERIITKQLAQRPGRRDPVEVAARVQHRLFARGEWPKWMASPTPYNFLIQSSRWCRKTLDRNDRVDSWAAVPDAGKESQSPIEATERHLVRSALAAALRLCPVRDAEVLKLTWTHELLEPEIRWIIEKEKPINHRITGAYRRLFKTIARLCPGALDDVDIESSSATPPPQSDRRRTATSALRVHLAGLPRPVPPARWQTFELIDTPVGTPALRPKRTRLSTYTADRVDPLDRAVLDDDAVAAIALGWLYGCGWSASENPADRHSRGARLAHLLATGRTLDEIRAEAIDVADDDRTLAEWHALRTELYRWLVDHLDVNPNSAHHALDTPSATTPDDQEDE